ncbi:unnamed protein product [Arabidopsis lyrata]|uniref:Uncharacterized protein n=3 Tax=Arabidopsis TaxID=3701 RepID=D7MHR0_ARALL|nr:hypothetical protein ARALYDRAFT_915657 [Arabidopsis lyrata subsp. lyrata]KAG7528871.1 hypothetical protein ISN44_Un153g000020 [Arabidopsis suecica]KAG7529052.1 hypothetical protein ISN45_Un101g000030 [Arabidopsis thaliana x Arabidopsis arenosa]CAH8262933.1 unnamed protein product [Arabidopsis lyrata]KAG7528887.1 hypothetical protein ISN44_Un153g000210 [Arabidopsis suecica]
MLIRMNHLFRGVKSLPARQDDRIASYKFCFGAWKHIRTLEWKWKRDVTPVPLEIGRSLAQE